ncbi:MAG: abortive infection family protein [Novosphingobium sp.]
MERFLRDAGHSFSLANRSRVPAVREFLDELSRETYGDDALISLVEKVADPRDYIGEPEKLKAVAGYLNTYLEFDGLGLVREGKTMRVRKIAVSCPVVDAFADKTIALNFEAVSAEVARALESAERDPPVAVTAACVIIESVCRAILAELDLEAPSKRDVDGLLRAVQEPLGLSPSRSDLAPLIAADVKQVLGGLTTVAKGVGAMRTHGGSAHATELGQAPIDARIARFAIHSASTIALFLVETLERKQRRGHMGSAS